MAQHANVTFDHGRIVRCWRERESYTVKYSSLPGIHALHDFLAIKNPDQTAIMKVHDIIYSGPLINTPMRVSKDILPTTSVIPTVSDT